MRTDRKQNKKHEVDMADTKEKLKVLNSRKEADPPPIKTVEKAGSEVFKAQYDTRIRPNQYFRYDGRCREKLQITAEDIYEFKATHGMTAHACRALVKGILMSDPKLINAHTEVKLVEAALQISTTARAIGKTQMLQLMAEAPWFQLQQALSCILNHDGDLIHSYSDEWWKWRSKHAGLKFTVNLRTHRMLATQWGRKACDALIAVDRANKTRGKMTGELRRITPQLQVVTAKGNILMAKAVAKVHQWETGKTSAK
jgi:hypothetical protein